MNEDIPGLLLFSTGFMLTIAQVGNRISGHGSSALHILQGRNKQVSNIFGSILLKGGSICFVAI